MDTNFAVITGIWEARTVRINGRLIAPTGFAADLQAAEDEPGDNQDIQQECRWVRRFAWGESSRSPGGPEHKRSRRSFLRLRALLKPRLCVATQE
jgi:hypothetical protein